MTKEAADLLIKSMLGKGYTQEQINEIIPLIPEQPQIINQKQDSLETLLVRLAENPSVKEIIQMFLSSDINKKNIEVDSENKFHSFLKKIDITQKIYNLFFVIVACVILYYLKTRDVIGKETAQTVVVLIIGLSMQDAISSFYKASSSKDSIGES